MRHRGLERVPEAILREAIARTPLDQWVVWDGSPCRSQANSLRSRALSCVSEVWAPIPLRTLLQRAAALSGDQGLNPEAVRNAIRMHQSARPAAYLLVRRTPLGEYVALTDVPWPSAAPAPLRAGDLVLDRHGRAFGDGAVKAA